MSWFHERTDDGWVVLDDNRAIVANVPDAVHEREDDAIQIALTANGSVHYGELKRGVDRYLRTLEQDADSRRSVIRYLVERLASDVSLLQAQLKERGPDYVTSVWLAAHTRELVEAQADLDAKRLQITAVRALVEEEA
ncbi:MAG: hypothetical protein IPJ77_11320 [Planctomycetes bacterium]|nr:hypothetical protein [Planctomycetota bacterium]